MDRRRVLLSLAAPSLGASTLRAGSRPISYPVFGGLDDPFRQYCIEVLKLAIAHCGVSYSLQAVPQPVGQERAIRALAAGQGALNLLWSMTSEARERELRPLRIPLDRGLMGWRLLLVREQDQARFAGVRHLDGLRDLVAGQMHDWPDTQILRANGLHVGTGSSYENLFAMLQRGRTDFFPRSVLEIEDDLKRFGGPHQLAIAPGLMLRYPTAFYFFVSPREPGLAEDLSRGLERIVSEGLWQALFAQHMRPQFKRLALHERLVLNLRNPLLPSGTPLRRPELWEEPGHMSG